MKLATKKFFHNVLALVVSVCMVCTLTPSAAWAADSSDDPFYDPEYASSVSDPDLADAGSDGGFIGEGDGTATGSTEVKAKVYNANFRFADITRIGNCKNVGALQETLNNSPLEASFVKSALPDNFTITWTVQKLTVNPDFKPELGESEDNPKYFRGKAETLVEHTYAKGDNIPVDSKGNPLFTYPDSPGVKIPVSDLGKYVENEGMYEFAVKLKNTDNSDEASATSKVTIYSDYPNLTLNGIGETPSDANNYQVKGSIYQAFALPTPYSPDLSVAEVTSGTGFDALTAAANGNGDEISTATSLLLNYDTDQLPSGKKPYLDGDEGNGLQVTIPLPEGYKAGDKVNIYEYNESTAPAATAHKDVVVEMVTPEGGGEPYPVAVIEVSGTGVNVGTFALGTPMTGSYNIRMYVTEGGSIAATGVDGMSGTVPMGKTQDFTALAVGPGYAFAGFMVSKTSEPAAPENANDYETEGVSGNSLKLDPVKYSVAKNETVYIKAFFTKVGPTEENPSNLYTVDAYLSASDNKAGGTMTMAPAMSYENAPSAVTISMNNSDPGRLANIPDYAGLFLQFAPDAGCVIDYVRVNGEDLAFNYGNEQVMIGALTANTTIQVGYKVQPAGSQDPKPGAETPLKARFYKANEWPTGINRAFLLKQDGTLESNRNATVEYTDAKIGNSYTITLAHNGNYRVESATLISADGSEIDVTSSMTTSDDEDSLVLHNIASGMTVVFDYIPKEAGFTGTATGGTGSIWVDDKGTNSNTNSGTRAKAARLAASAPRSGVEANINVDTANKQLTEGNRARILAEPMDGYELGRVEINNTNVTDYFKVHEDGTWTMTVYRTETGIVPDGQGEWEVTILPGTKWAQVMTDSVVDNVVPIEGTLVSLVMTFNEKVPTSGSYQTITTRVEGVGGTITPSLKVEKGASATVEFFPDDTYRVARIEVDGTTVSTFSDPSPDSSLRYEFENVTSDHTITVEFAAGSTRGTVLESYTVTPMAYAGGSISPSQPVKVYKGDSFNFSLIPKTGYMLTDDPEVEGSATLERKGYTCTLSDIGSDCNLIARFSPIGDEVSPTHIVRTTYNAEGGTVSPSSPFVVANGADAHFTFLPNDGWYVKGVYVVDGKMVEANEDAGRGINLAGSVQDGRMFSLRDIQADTVVDVVFGNLNDDFGPGDSEEKKKHEPPEIDPAKDTFKLNLMNSQIGEGATVSPNLSDLTFVKAKDKDGNTLGHAAAGTDLTIIISSGYGLDEDQANGGISIKHGDTDVTTEPIDGKKITIKSAGDGLYEVKIPAEFITPDMSITVNTKKESETQVVINKAYVNVNVSGNGAVYPAADADGRVEVESGKSQTFSFVPEQGWKLHRVYVNDEAITVTGNAYTIHNITGDTTTLQAVFVEGEPDQPVVAHNVNIVNKNSSNGTVTPEGLTKVADGAALSILVEPRAGYRVVATQVIDRQTTELPIAGNTIEIANIKEPRTINVDFESISSSDLISLVVIYNAGGTVSPAGNTLIAKGQTQTLSILPDAGKAVKSVTLSEGGRSAVSATNENLKVTTSGKKGIIYTTPAAKEKMVVEVVFCDEKDKPTTAPYKDLPTGNDLRDKDGNTTYHEVTAFVAAGGGTVVPTYAKVADGATMTYTFVPLDGYKFESATWTPAGGRTSSVSPRPNTNNTTYVTDAVTSDAELRVTFVKDDAKSELEKYYTVFASAKGEGKNTTAGAAPGGTISPTGAVTVAGGGSQSFTIMPDPNCLVSRIVITNKSNNVDTTVPGKDVGSSYTLFGVSSDLTFTVYFKAVEPEKGETAPPTFLTHSISASASLNGSISPAGTRTVDHGGDAMFTFIPWDGYKLSYIIVDGANIPANLINNMQYTFAKVTENHSIHAVFIGESEKATDFARVDVHFTDNGTASPRGAVLVEKGQPKTIDVTPFLGYKVVDITIDGTSITPAGTFSYTNGTISNTNLTYGWSNGQLTLKSVDNDTDVGIKFGVDETYRPGTGGDETAPSYEKVSTKSDPVTGGGKTSIQPDPVYLVKPPTNPSELEDPLQTKMDITITPEDGKIPEKIVVKYGDGTEKVYDDTTSPSVKKIFEDGYITVDTNRGDVDVDIKYRDLTNAEKDAIKNGTLTPATYVEVKVNYSAGGTVGPAGTIKVAKGSNLTLQMIPNANYEVALVTVDGANKTGSVLKKTRTYIEKGIQTNKEIYVGFGFVKSDEPEQTYTLEAKVAESSDANSGSISPSNVEVRKGSTQIVYFLPAAGYKIGKVSVTRGDAAPEVLQGFNSPSMAIRNIESNVKVEVEYIPGENSWTLPTVPLKVEVGAGAGRVSPDIAELPVGSAVDVNFYPDDEWTASYYTLNGQTYSLPQNVSSWPVTPDPEAQGEDANIMRVFFERYSAHDVDHVINVKLVDCGDGSGYHGSASPYQATVPSAGSTTFYVVPEVKNGAGYTIDYVRFNGVDQQYDGVLNVGYSEKQSYNVNSVSGINLGTRQPILESEVNGLTGNNKTFYNVYSVTLNNVLTSGTLEIKFKKIPNGSGTMVTTDTPTMTVTSVGGGMVNPVGQVTIPAGETLDILTTSFESYFLSSVIKEEAGGVTTDLTGDVVGRVAKATMGKRDCTVTVTFNRVGQPEAPVNVSLIKATYNDGTNTTDITKDVRVGGYIDPDTGDLVPIHLNEKGELCEYDDEGKLVPIGYVRGGSYEFYFDTSVRGKNDRELVLKSATYAGKNLSIIPGANYLTNVVLNASGGFELEFRELNEGEQMLNPAKGYYIDVEVRNENGANGWVTPAGPFTRQPGGSVEIALNSNSENVAVSYIQLVITEDNSIDGPTVKYIDVPNEEYADGTYTLSNIDRDYTIRVVFDMFSIVRVNWDNSLGFITPNHEPGSYIYRPIGKSSLPFLVAPYQDSELVGVYVGESADSLAELSPSDDEEFEKELKDKLGLSEPEDEEQGGIMAMALGDDDDEPAMIVQPSSTDFAKVYGVTAPLAEGGNTYVTAQFRSTKVNENRTIKASVKSGPGSVDPSGDVSVPYGGSQTFTATPERGYAVIGLIVDGNRVPATSTYTFTNVIADHTIEFEFGLPQAANGNGGTGSSGSGADRLLRVASSLAQTGDLTGPVVGMFLVIAAAGLVVTGVSYIRRQQRRRRRMAARQ